jgi:hypothetical protein
MARVERAIWVREGRDASDVPRKLGSVSSPMVLECMSINVIL